MSDAAAEADEALPARPSSSGSARWIRRLDGGMRAVFGSARLLGVAVVGAALVLRLMQSMLYVRTGWGAEDFLGWADDGPAGPALALLALWRDCGLVWLARAYLAFDSVVFVPLYAAFFLATGRVLATALQTDAGQPGATGRRWLAVFWAPVLTLVGVDLLENLLGLERTQGAGPWIGLAALALGLLGLQHRAGFGRWRIGAQRPALACAAAALVALVAWFHFGTDACAAADGASWRGRLGCATHAAKLPLVVATLLVPLAGGACWFFGVLPSLLPDVPGNRDRALLRAALRSAVFDCLVRSRYVLAALALLAALTVVMDQSRDIIASTASFVPRFFDRVGDDLPGALLLLLGSLTVFSLSVLALALLVFACWLWTRSVCHLRSAGARAAAAGLGWRDPGDRHEDVFARDWARVLALVPILLVVQLCARVLRDLAEAQIGTAGHVVEAAWPGCLLPSLGVVAFAVLAVVVGGRFLWQRGAAASGGGYYDCIDWGQWSRRVGLLDAKAHEAGGKYSFLGRVTPYLLPLAALLLVFVCRFVDVLPGRTGEHFPTMAFPVILLSVTFWLCFFGWLSLLEVYNAVPWVLALFAWVGVLGLAGLTDNHLVWPGPLPGEYSDRGGMRMLACSALLGGVVAAAYRWAMARVRAAADGSGAARTYWRLILLVPALAAVIVAGNFVATARRPGTPPQHDDAPPVALDAALARWLTALCNSPGGTGACTPTIAPNPRTGDFDVYFVSSEGGGIRAAAWTALALHRLEREDPAFAQRSFAISAVSGGAVGAAVYRACGATDADAAARERCILRFARTDLLSPLLSSWMFEDLIGKLVPSSACKTPGCGFMSRGAWFEQAMEAGAPRLRRGLRELRRDDTKGGDGRRHVPYLLLNATWVETGERAIATELVVSSADFPGSKDQLGLVGADMPLGAAAHNAARFPYVNAIGGLKAPPALCNRRGGAASGAAASGSPAAEPTICGHLADGGYFDNGGAQSTADLVRALGACLVRGTAGPAAAAASAASAAPRSACDDIPAPQRQWLREHLVPRVLMIRNESDPGAAGAQDCAQTLRPTGAQIAPRTDNVCTTPIGTRYRPDRPVCTRGGVPYLDLIGPLLAVINTSGIGAGGRLAEAREAQAVAQLRLAMGGRAAGAATEPVTAIDLLPRGVHFPLGWHLSAAAVDDMSGQAALCGIATPAARP